MHRRTFVTAMGAVAGLGRVPGFATGDPLDKAGAYAIQHPLFEPVAHLEGCYTAVMGLSVCSLILALAELKIPHQADLAAVRQAHQTLNRDFPCPIYEKHFATW